VASIDPLPRPFATWHEGLVALAESLSDPAHEKIIVARPMQSIACGSGGITPRTISNNAGDLVTANRGLARAIAARGAGLRRPRRPALPSAGGLRGGPTRQLVPDGSGSERTY
jgi:hypothetical protein